MCFRKDFHSSHRYVKFAEVTNSNTSKCIILYPITLTILSSSFEIRLAQFQQQLLIPHMVKKFLSSAKRPGRFWGPTCFPFNGQRELFSRWQTSRSVKLTAHLHLVTRLRLSGAISPHPTWTHSLHRNNFALRRTSDDENELIFTPYVRHILKLEFDLLLKKLNFFASIRFLLTELGICHIQDCCCCTIEVSSGALFLGQTIDKVIRSFQAFVYSRIQS